MSERKGEHRTMQLELSQLHTDGGTQPRVAINDDTVTEYAEALREGVKFPPVVAFRDSAKYWLADGFHRYHAHRRAGLDKIEVDIREGTLREAILYSVGANTEHGLRRTNADKRKAVTTMLTNDLVAKEDDGTPWSDRAIARRCGVHHDYVGKVRGSLSPNDSEKRPQRRAYTTKHGTKAVMNTAKIGRFQRPPHSPKPANIPPGTPPSTPPPIIQHGRRMPKTALELPHDARWAARAVVNAMGREFARALATELTTYLDGPGAQLCTLCGDPNCVGDCERDESDQT